jgi:hypothetical protein
MISASFRIIYYFAYKSPESIIRTNIVFPYQKTETFLVNPKMPWQTQCQLQDILRTSWTEFKRRASKNRADELKATEGGRTGLWNHKRRLRRRLCACPSSLSCPV